MGKMEMKQKRIENKKKEWETKKIFYGKRNFFEVNSSNLR